MDNSALNKLTDLLREALDTDVYLTDIEEPDGNNGQEVITLSLGDRLEKRVVITKKLTDSEKRLVLLLINQTQSLNAVTLETDSPVEVCKSWLQKISQNQKVDVPTLLTAVHWETGKVPLLLKAGGKNKIFAEEIEHLIHSYVKEDEGYEDGMWSFTLNPNECFICVPITSFIDDDTEYETVEEQFSTAVVSWAEGLNDLLQSEAGQTYRIAYGDPVNSPTVLAGVWHALEKTHLLAKRFRWKKKIISQKDLAILKMLEHMSIDELKQITNELWSAADQTLLQDEELVVTFEHFFDESLNVSETARKLYVHRNTLLYRLEKFRQETGYDVKKFDDALIVRLSLLMLQSLQTK